MKRLPFVDELKEVRRAMRILRRVEKSIMARDKAHKKAVEVAHQRKAKGERNVHMPLSGWALPLEAEHIRKRGG